MRFLLSYFKDRSTGFILFLLCCAVFLCTFALYRLPVKAVLYPSGICAAVIAAFTAVDCSRAYRKHHLLVSLQSLPENILDGLSGLDSSVDSDYAGIIRLLREEENRLRRRYREQEADMTEYYTLWVHQIKTPIASMRLTLQSEDTPFSRQLSDDLFRIEQYVEMVLCYIRLDPDSTDYVFKEYVLDGIVKQAVRRFAGQFIGKSIKLAYSPIDAKVITDEKWLLFVIEQVLSNALKYTPQGGTITIDLESPATLCIRDTGIGISPADIPLVFGKGYTGGNGRSDKKASGIGLYLCRRICKNLGHSITLSSQVDVGTVVRLDLHTYDIAPE